MYLLVSHANPSYPEWLKGGLQYAFLFENIQKSPDYC